MLSSWALWLPTLSRVLGRLSWRETWRLDKSILGQRLKCFFDSHIRGTFKIRARTHTTRTHTHSQSALMAGLIIKRWVSAAGILVFALLEHSHIFPPGSIGSPPYARGFCANNMYKYVLEYNTCSYMRIYAHVCVCPMCMCVCILCNAQVIVRILINSLCSRHTSWGTVR